MTEWRDIPGYEGIYQASDDGQIRSLDRDVDKGKWGVVRFPGVVKKQFLTFGYPSVALRKQGKCSNHFVHRLVASAFLADGHFEGALVLHGDGDPHNNHLSNLRWGSHSDNGLDAVSHGTHSMTVKTHCPQGHPYDEENTAVRYVGGGTRPSRICRACKRAHNRRRHHLQKRRAKAS